MPEPEHVLYDEVSISSTMIAPQFTRIRHRYNGVRESRKINIHADYMYMMIGRLYTLWNNFKGDLQGTVKRLESGGDLSSVKDSQGNDVTISGLENHFNRVRDLRDRVSVLEHWND